MSSETKQTNAECSAQLDGGPCDGSVFLERKYHLWARKYGIRPGGLRYDKPGFVLLTREHEPLTHQEALTMRSKFSNPAYIMLYPSDQNPHDLPNQAQP